jgi:hypothetical protein
MPKVYGIHHTQLDSLSVAPYNVRTLFGINGGPLEMASDFFSPSLILAEHGLGTRRGWFLGLHVVSFNVVIQCSARTMWCSGRDKKNYGDNMVGLCFAGPSCIWYPSIWFNVVHSTMVGGQLLAASACAHCDGNKKQHSQSLAFWTWSNPSPRINHLDVCAALAIFRPAGIWWARAAQRTYFGRFFVRSRPLTGRDRAEFSEAILRPELHL